MNAKEKFTAKEIWKQRNSYHPNDLGRHYCEEVAKETALENTFVKSINPESVEDMRNALELAMKLFKAMEEQLPDLPMLNHIGYQFTRNTIESTLEKSKL